MRLLIITAEKEGVALEYGSIGQILWRMIAIFALALVVVRFMGNRTVGQFSPFDFVLMVGIGDIVGNVATDRSESLLTGVEALIALFLLQQVLSRLSLKSRFLRKWFEGKPVVIIENGKIIRDNLVKTQFNLDDLRQELHKQGLDFTNLEDIKLARLESCGDFSVVKAPEVEPLTKKDLTSFINSLSENPLSPAGTFASRVEQLMLDVRVLAQHIKDQQAVPTQKEPAAQDSTKRLH
jgi:uncharacterized membrane protein YcaP (DUF421 family)